MDEIVELFEESISDEIFGRSEKREIKQYLQQENLSKREIDFVRSKIFDLALEKVSAENFNIVNWLENANKALNIKHKKAKKEEEIYFSPGSACKSAILREIGNAVNTLDICVFTISDNDISRKIIDTHKRGVKVRVLTDNDKLHDKGSDINQLSNAGLDVKIDNTRHHMHHKFAIIDSKTVLTGSYNWTRSAELYNHENVIVLHDIDINKQYKNEFNKLWKKMTSF